MSPMMRLLLMTAPLMTDQRPKQQQQKGGHSAILAKPNPQDRKFARPIRKQLDCVVVLGFFEWLHSAAIPLSTLWPSQQPTRGVKACWFDRTHWSVKSPVCMRNFMFSLPLDSTKEEPRRWRLEAKRPINVTTLNSRFTATHFHHKETRMERNLCQLLIYEIAHLFRHSAAAPLIKLASYFTAIIRLAAKYGQQRCFSTIPWTEQFPSFIDTSWNLVTDLIFNVQGPFLHEYGEFRMTQRVKRILHVMKVDSLLQRTFPKLDATGKYDTNDCDM